MSDQLVRSICAEFDIEVVSGDTAPKPGQTRALITLGRIMKKHGEGHLRLVLSTLAETRGNEGLINEFSIWAVSDLIFACEDLIERSMSEWLEIWDRMPLGFVMWRCGEMRGLVKQRAAMTGTLYYLIWLIRDDIKPGQEANKTLKALVRKTDEERAENLRAARAIALGDTLLKVRAILPPDEFIAWVKEKSGISYETALESMREAKAAA